MYATKLKNGMNIQIGEFMHKRYLFVWGDHEWYAYNEYMLIPSMFIMRVCGKPVLSTEFVTNATTMVMPVACGCCVKAYS